MIDSVVFDLDGTLWDTCATCAIGWNRVLQRRGIDFRTITDHDIRRVAGKPHEQCIRETFIGLPETRLRTLIAETQREDNVLVAQIGGILYPQVESGVKRLGARLPLLIVSNCQAGYIEAFLAWSGLGAHFRDFECWGRTGLSKASNLGMLIERNGLCDPVLVGDTPGDWEAAREYRIPFLYVDYGFGVCTGADRRFSSFGDVAGFLLGKLPLTTDVAASADEVALDQANGHLPGHPR